MNSEQRGSRGEGIQRQQNLHQEFTKGLEPAEKADAENKWLVECLVLWSIGSFHQSLQWGDCPLSTPKKDSSFILEDKREDLWTGMCCAWNHVKTKRMKRIQTWGMLNSLCFSFLVPRGWLNVGSFLVLTFKMRRQD